MVFEPRHLFLAIMPFTLVLPLIAIALLRKNTHVPVSNWYVGCLCLAAAYILISLRVSLPVWASFHLAQVVLIGGLCLMLSCYRQNLGWVKHQSLLVSIVLTHVMIFSVLFDLGNEVWRQTYVNLISAILVYALIYHSQCLARRDQSRGLLLCTFGFGLAELGHLVRLLGLNLGFGAANPVAPSWDNLFLMVALLFGTLLINYGYFGYVLERVRDQVQRSQADLSHAVHERDRAYVREQALAQVVEERDRLLTVMAQTNRHATLDLLAANVAHEINQPLAAVTLNLYTLQSALQAGGEVAKAVELVDCINQDVQRIKSVVQQVRALSRYQSLDVEPVLLRDSVSEACALLKGQCQEHGIELLLGDIDDTLWVQGNRVLMVQLLLNVLLNAVQALSDKTQGIRWIKVSCWCCAAADHAAVFIEDNGPGLPAEVASHVFEMFQTTKRDGTGLGLPLCQTIIRRLGGQIALRQKMEGGVIVSLTFKLA